MVRELVMSRDYGLFGIYACYAVVAFIYGVTQPDIMSLMLALISFPIIFLCTVLLFPSLWLHLGTSFFLSYVLQIYFRDTDLFEDHLLLIYDYLGFAGLINIVFLIYGGLVLIFYMGAPISSPFGLYRKLRTRIILGCKQYFDSLYSNQNQN